MPNKVNIVLPEIVIGNRSENPNKEKESPLNQVLDGELPKVPPRGIVV